MADIFISYARKDRPKVSPLGKALQDQGWTVFWDRVIPGGKTWDEVIEEELDAARCVVVVWSINGISSRWVRAEAEEGLNKNILVPVSIEDLKPPLLFRPIQAVQLTDWNEDSTHRQFTKFIIDLESILGPSPLKTKAAEEEKKKAEAQAKQQREAERLQAEENEKRRQVKEEAEKIAATEAKQKEEQRLRAKEKEAQRKAAEEKQRAEAERKAEEERKQKKVEARHREEQGEIELKVSEDRDRKDKEVQDHLSKNDQRQLREAKHEPDEDHKTADVRTGQLWFFIFLTTIGWAIGGAIGGYISLKFYYIYWYIGSSIFMSIGSLVTLVALCKVVSGIPFKNLFYITIGSAIAGVMFGYIRWDMTINIWADMANAGNILTKKLIWAMIGFFCLGIGGVVTVGTVKQATSEIQLRKVVLVIIGWALAGALGWAILGNMYMNYVYGIGVQSVIHWIAAGAVIGFIGNAVMLLLIAQVKKSE